MKPGLLPLPPPFLPMSKMQTLNAQSAGQRGELEDKCWELEDGLTLPTVLKEDPAREENSQSWELNLVFPLG